MDSKTQTLHLGQTTVREVQRLRSLVDGNRESFERPVIEDVIQSLRPAVLRASEKEVRRCGNCREVYQGYEGVIFVPELK